MVAYGSALTGTVAALGWLTTSLVDQIRSDLRDHETRPSSRQREREEALTHLTDLEHNLCLGLQDANAYWGSVAETVDPK